MTKKKGLGRGLDALMEDLDQDFSLSGGVLEVEPASVAPNPYQPRRQILPKDIKELTESVRQKGVLEPLLVRPKGDGRWELIAGERRLQAAKQAGLKRVPVMVREASESEMLEIALIENLHREDLNPIEEAEAYQRLAREFSRSQAQIAEVTGRDRSTVANLMRLLNLPLPVQEDVRQGRLSAGHARALLPLDEQELILQARKTILMKGLSVRQAEALVKTMLRPPAPRPKREEHQAYFQSLADQITRRVGARVRLIRRGKKGRIEIPFSSDRELERLLAYFGVGRPEDK